ncbi:MAG: hypothetical protein PPP55_00505 [Halorubrum sp.]
MSGRDARRPDGGGPSSGDPLPLPETRSSGSAHPSRRRLPDAAADPLDRPPAAVLDTVPTGTSLRTTLAAAARSRGRACPWSSDIRSTRAAIASLEFPDENLEPLRRRLADAAGEEERLKEQVAALRGDARARRAVGAETTESLAKLREAAATLSAAQTKRIAAEQALERARERARAARDERERRLRLRDRLQNRQREARQRLATAVYPPFREALSFVPDGRRAIPGDDVTDYTGSPLAASFAAVRIASIEGPVVLSRDAARAFETWGGPPAEQTLGVPVTSPEP